MPYYGLYGSYFGLSRDRRKSAPRNGPTVRTRKGKVKRGK